MSRTSSSQWQGPYTYAGAAAYLAKGRRKTYRPIVANTYLARVDDHRIALVLHHTAVVTYNDDDTVSLYTGGWSTAVTVDRIASFSPARIWGRKEMTIPQDGDPLSPPRVQKCRTCHGEGGRDYHPYCSQWTYGSGGPTKVAVCKHGVKGGGHETTETEWIPCYRCDGKGRVDYGSKRLPYVWDGQPVDMSNDGVLLGDSTHDDVTAPPRPYTPKVKEHSYYGANVYYGTSTSNTYGTAVSGDKVLYGGADMSNGSETLRELTEVLSGLRTEVECPSCVREVRGPVHEIVVHLNDTHRWTREAIADWLESLDVDLTFATPSTTDTEESTA